MHSTLAGSARCLSGHHCASQSWRTFGWGKPGGHLWGNLAEPAEFSDSGRRLAFVIWVHYLSKVLTAALSWKLAAVWCSYYGSSSCIRHYELHVELAFPPNSTKQPASVLRHYYYFLLR